MNKSCLYCHQKLGFLQAVRGELFCSSDHREAYFQAEVALAFERVTSFDRPTALAASALAASSPETPSETPQAVLEVQPIPFVESVAPPVPVSVPEPKPELLQEVTKALPILLAEAQEPVRVPEPTAPPVIEPVVEAKDKVEDERKEEIAPVLSAMPVPEPVPVPEVKDEPKEEVPPPMPVLAIEAPSVLEVKPEVEPVVAPEAKAEIKEDTALPPVVALEPPKIPEAKEPVTTPVAPAARPMIKIPEAKAGQKRPKWVAPAIAACLAIVALGAIFFGPSKKSANSLLPNATPPLAAAEKPVPVPVPAPAPELASAPPAPVQAAPVSTPAPAPAPAPAPKPAPAPPAPAPKPAPAPVVAVNTAVNTSGAHHAASITVKETAWVAVCSDGNEVLATMMSPGDERKIDFTGKAIVRTGNAGGIAITVDGKSVGPVGPQGGLRVVELNPQVNPNGFHYLALKPGENGACVSN